MRDILKKTATNIFLTGDRVGVHVQPAHYYSSVASRRQLRETESGWRRPLAPMPFRWDLDEQAGWLAGTAATFAAELPVSALPALAEPVGGLRYGGLEAQLLYSFLRATAPARALEIGSGSSTLVMSRAVERNVAVGRPATAITACDPYTAGHVDGLAHVRALALGGLDIDAEVGRLQAGDLLFIDSTHTLRTGSELAHLYLEVLPHLPSGVVVHIHDIYLPYLFSPDIYRTMFDWQETALVAALLTGNDRLQILACMSGLHHDRPDALAAAFPDYRRAPTINGLRADEHTGHFPSALWLQVR